MTRLCIGSWGIAHPGWDQSFYPEDLPADWRFDYYGNSQHCAAVAPADWPTLVEAGAVDEALDGLPADFHLYFAFDDHAALANWLAHTPDLPGVQGLLVAADGAADLAALKVLSLGLSRPLWVWPRAGLDHAAVHRAGLTPCWSESAPDGERAALGVIELDETGDLRARRALLERFAAGCGERGDLLLSPASAARSSEDMLTLTTLGELMGY